jgi:hypothetical protein
VALPRRSERLAKKEEKKKLQASTKEEQNPPKKARKQETNFTVEHCKKIPPPPQKVFSGEGKNREVVKAGSLEKKTGQESTMARWPRREWRTCRNLLG